MKLLINNVLIRTTRKFVVIVVGHCGLETAVRGRIQTMAIIRCLLFLGFSGRSRAGGFTTKFTTKYALCIARWLGGIWCIRELSRVDRRAHRRYLPAQVLNLISIHCWRWCGVMGRFNNNKQRAPPPQVHCWGFTVSVGLGWAIRADWRTSWHPFLVAVVNLDYRRFPFCELYNGNRLRRDYSFGLTVQCVIKVHLFRFTTWNETNLKFNLKI